MTRQCNLIRYISINVRNYFQGSEGTTSFIRLFDRLFDLLNSRNPWAQGYKAPIRRRSEHLWLSFVTEAAVYIKQLQSDKGNLLVSTPSRTPFIGFLLAIQTIQGLYQDYVLPGKLGYLLTYKLSQDHLELWFAAVRAGLGSNDNPSCREFCSLYKKLLVRHQIKGVTGM